MPVADRLIRATRTLRRDVDSLHFGAPITHVYNPIAYAARPHNAYLRRYADARRRVVFLGMNPGPYGMAQTGVPFGEIARVRDWLGIEGRVDVPEHEHPKRPVQGFACTRSEVSGARLWGAIAEHFGTPERFFRHHFIANYCPLVFMEASGRNCTPDKLPAPEREPLFERCDRFLSRLVELLEPEWIVGVGAFATGRAREALAGADVQIGQILHPSPANPRANKDWTGEVRGQLRALGLCRD
ncbi:MAG: single-stranded DNA-binding protein [Deltaproteobacteria bacterium]|jgi:single-strand selective monofunctional uracil DNA glycosylase|nr:single-stranded DNA-binding protein [Deltaproteobacteria bacterium]